MIERGLRVLVVDDDEEDFLILRDLLADLPQAGYKLEWACNFDAGAAAIHAGNHDVYVVDYRLGPESGLDLVRLAAADPRRYRPVILLTGRGNPEVDREALAAGAADYLVKGQIDADALARSIRYAAERARERIALAEGRERYRLMFDLNPMPAWVYEIESGAFIDVNEAMLRHYGYSREELAAMTILDIRSPTEAERLRLYRRERDQPFGFAGVWPHLRRDGSTLYAEVWTHDLTLDGRLCRMTIANDISARRQAQERAQLFERAVQSSASGVVICDAQAPDFPLIFVNAAFERLSGYTQAEVLGRNCRFLQGEERNQAELDLIRHALRSDTDCNVLLRNFRKDGVLFWNHLFLSPVRDESQRVTHFLGVLNDLTERRQIEADLAYAGSHDAVTGLPRYPVVESLLAGLLGAGDTKVAVLFIDLDRFHAINESMGHVFGDEVLHLIAAHLRAAMQGRGHIARFAGDEFVAVLADADSAQAHAVAEHLRHAVNEPIEGDGYRLRLTASIGISLAPAHGHNAMDLLRRAEAAMTRAKRQGRDAVCEFALDQMQELEDRLLLGARLREAPHRGELELHYQPLMTADEKMLGFEALLRWSNPELGRVSPARFIPIAEGLGLMSEIGHWVIEEACRQLRAWDDEGLRDFTLAVNFSAQELQRPDVIAVVRDAITRHGIEASRLEIEITESSLMEHVDRVVGVIAELKQLGVKLSLDDFGTGYSSLAYLKQFALDKIKIDRTFVRDLPQDADDAAIARTIVAIGHQLRMKVVAEGVETPGQATYLRDIGCDQLQGYLFSPPVPAARAMELLRASRGG